MQIIVTDFAKRHFQENPGTTILSHSPEQFAEIVSDPENKIKGNYWWRSAYNGFCYYMTIKNFTDAKAGSIKITPKNERYLVSEYSSRRPEELPYLHRYMKLPEDFEVPVAEYLTLILYTREQIEKEAQHYPGENKDLFIDKENEFSYYGIVGIQGVMEPIVEPMTPYTAVRNALGAKWGGNGAEIDQEYIREAAKYWNEHAVVK